MSFVVDKELLDGHPFNYIDKEGKSAYSRQFEVVLKVDPNAWILSWEHARKRQNKVKYERSFVFVDSIVDVRINLRNAHEMILVCARNYTEPQFFHFVAEQAVIFHWSRCLFQMAYSKKACIDAPIQIVSKLLMPVKVVPNKKCHTTIAYEHWTQEHGNMTKKLIKHHKHALSSDEDPVDTYLRFVPRPDLQQIFNQISNGHTKSSPDQFADFINKTQSDNQCITEAQALQLIQSLESNQRELSYHGFVKFMTSNECDRFGVVFRDADDKNYYAQPISHYFLKSSHNTYLNGTQILLAKNLPNNKHSVCQSDVEMYRQILLSGCRCIELDLWDGHYGHPVVTHGPIALQRINVLPLTDVCEAIMECAFKTSSFPVILSLENHCSTEQQEVVFKTFTAIFGKHLLCESLYDYPLTTLTELPPPYSLNYKILLKGTRRRESKKSSDQLSSKCSFPNPMLLLKNWEKHKIQANQLLTDVREKRQQFRERKNSSNGPSSPRSPRIGGLFNQMGQMLNDLKSLNNLNNLNELPTTSSSSDSSLVQQFSTDDEDAESVQTVEMCSTLADLINYFQSSHDLLFDDPAYMMHSGGEQKIDKAISLHKQVFINHTINHIIRVYPSAWRVDSSNFSPLNFMVAGCQMVSMNFQTAGTPMQYYDSFFFDQLGQTSGYVLKPPVLLQQIPKEGPYKAYRLEISLFSAQFLNLLSCKCRKGMGKVTVRISLYDLPHNFVINKFEIVSTKSEEGFNTAFEANSVIFDRIITPELTMLHIRVSDESGSKLAQRFLRVNQVQSGYRHLTLRNRYNRPEPAFLFGRFKLVEYEPDESIRELYMDPLRDRFNIEEAKKLANARDKQLRWAQKTGDQNKNDSLVSWESQATNDSFGHSSRKSSSCASPRMSRGSLNILDGSGSNSRSPSTAFNFDNDRKVPTLPPKPCVNSGSVASINSSDIPQPKISISTFYTDDFDEKEDAIKF